MFQSEKEKRVAHENSSINELEKARAHAEELMWQSELLDNEIARLNLLNTTKDEKIAELEMALSRANRSTKLVNKKVVELAEAVDTSEEKRATEEAEKVPSGEQDGSRLLVKDVSNEVEAKVEVTEPDANALPASVEVAVGKAAVDERASDGIKVAGNDEATSTIELAAHAQGGLSDTVRNELPTVVNSLVELADLKMVERLQRENTQIRMKLEEIKRDLSAQVQAMSMALQVEYKQKQILNKENEAYRLK